MEIIKCHFCGYETTEDELLGKCDRCPMKVSHAGLGVSCCPNCGIELKMKSTVVEFLELIGSKLGLTKK